MRTIIMTITLLVLPTTVVPNWKTNIYEYTLKPVFSYAKDNPKTFFGWVGLGMASVCSWLVMQKIKQKYRTTRQAWNEEHEGLKEYTARNRQLTAEKNDAEKTRSQKQTENNDLQELNTALTAIEQHEDRQKRELQEYERALRESNFMKNEEVQQRQTQYETVKQELHAQQRAIEARNNERATYTQDRIARAQNTIKLLQNHSK